MNVKLNRYLPYLLALGTVLFWASAFPATKYCLQYFSPEALMLLRFIIASIVLLLACFFMKIPVPKKKDVPLFVAAGFIGIFLYMWTFNLGTSMVTSGISSFIISVAPVITLILSAVFLKEKTSLRIWMGIVISFLGLVIIASTQVTEFSLNLGVVILFVASVCTSIYNVLQRRILKKYLPIQATAYCAAFATLFMLVFLPNLAEEVPKAPLEASLVVVYLAVFPAALAYFLWSFALSRAEKTVHVTSFLYLTPFLTIIMAFFWLGETIPHLAFIGGVIMIGGMIIANWERAK